MQYMQLSTSRDFRINAATLEAALQEQDCSQEVTTISNWSYHLFSQRFRPLCALFLSFPERGVTAGRGDSRTQREEEETLDEDSSNISTDQ